MQIDIIIVYIFQLNMSKSRNKMSKSLTHYNKLPTKISIHINNEEKIIMLLIH